MFYLLFLIQFFTEKSSASNFRCYLYQKDQHCILSEKDDGLIMSGTTLSGDYATDPDFGFYSLVHGNYKWFHAEKGITVIPTYFLNGKKELTYLYFEEGLTTISKSAFSNNQNIKDLRIPRTCKVIGVEAFKLNTGLRKVYLPANIKLNDRAFELCKDFTLYYEGYNDIECGQEVFEDSNPTIVVPRNYTSKTFCGKKVTLGSSHIMVIVFAFILILMI